MNALSRYFYSQSAGMFFLRLVTGLIFLLHGATKVGSIAMIAGFFGSLGLVPAIGWAWFIGLLEVIGGAALILGVATRVFGTLFAIEMIVAVFLTGIGKGFNAHALELLLAAASLAIALSGSGRWSVYPLECENCGALVCDGETCAAV